MDSKYISTWSEFVDLSNERDGWAFRGQQRADWQLWSSLSRHLRAYVADINCWAEREARAIRIFQRKAHSFVQDPLLLDDHLRCLALMQHHGAPTRLLDFTKSPYVAAFFALENAIEDAAVYAINTPYLWNAAPRDDTTLSRDVIDPRRTGNFDRYFQDNNRAIVWTGEPGKLDGRLLAQSGTFVIPGMIDRPLEVIIEQNYRCDDEPVIEKYTLSASMRREAMEAMYRMNLTYATLLPDLEGLARSSAFELEIIWKGIVAYPKSL